MDLFTLFARLTMDTSEFDEGIKDSEEKAGSFGKSLKTAAKVGTAAVAAVGTAVVGAGVSLVKGVGAVAEYGDNIDKMAQKMGMSAQAYQEWDAVMQHSGTSMETMKASMKTLANAAETGSDAFEKLGISQKELQTLSQEQLFERTISALQNVEDETQRTYLAGKTLGKGATELGALLNTSAEDTQAMRDRVRELGGVMSDDAVKAAAAYQDSLQDMQTAISGLKRGVMSDFMPALTSIMDGVTNLFSGDTEKGMEQLQEGIENVFSTIDDAIPKVLETGEAIFTAVMGALEQNMPQIAEKGTQILVSLTEGILEYAPAMLEQLPVIITSMLTVLIAEAPRLISAGIELLKALVSGVINTIPALVAAVPQIFGAFSDMWASLDWVQTGKNAIEWIKNGVNALFSMIPNELKTIGGKAIEFFKNVDWRSAGSQAITFIVNAVKGMASLIPSALVSIGQSAVSAFKSIDWFDLGSNVIRGIVNGIKSGVGWIMDAARDAASRALDAAKNFLGIKSPSRVFRDQVGKMIPRGLAMGIEQDTPLAVESAGTLARKTLLPFDDMEIPTIETQGGYMEGSDVPSLLAAILAFLQTNWNSGEPIPIVLGTETVGYYDKQMGLIANQRKRGVI